MEGHRPCLPSLANNCLFFTRSWEDRRGHYLLRMEHCIIIYLFRGEKSYSSSISGRDFCRQPSISAQTPSHPGTSAKSSCSSFLPINMTVLISGEPGNFSIHPDLERRLAQCFAETQVSVFRSCSREGEAVVFESFVKFPAFQNHILSHVPFPQTQNRLGAIETMLRKKKKNLMLENCQTSS